MPQSGAGDGLGLALILEAEGRLEAQEWQRALASAERALLALDQAEAEEPRNLRSLLLGRALRARGAANWRLGHPALAEADLSRGAALLDETALPLEARSQIRGELGDLKKSRRDFAGMCEAYRDACALGQCASLAQARREGHCQE